MTKAAKIEQTRFDTRIGAVRLEASSVVIIDRRLKRELLSEVIPVRRKFKVLSLFTSGVFLAIKPLLTEGDMIAMDNEYPNQMKHVIRALHSLIGAYGLPEPEQIVVASHYGVERAHLISRTLHIADYKLLVRADNAHILADLYRRVLRIIR
ncbi:MAG: hypothetical protein DRN06_03180 [Thermoprotei archaeon]|nr:MAG: hypothetical protein DRN06_03180 [Thermoprotei archaeon]